MTTTPDHPPADRDVMSYPLKPPFAIYNAGTDISDAGGHFCTAENSDIAKLIVATLNAAALSPAPGADRGLLRDLRPHVVALSATDDAPEYKTLLARVDAALAAQPVVGEAVADTVFRILNTHMTHTHAKTLSETIAAALSRQSDKAPVTGLDRETIEACARAVETQMLMSDYPRDPLTIHDAARAIRSLAADGWVQSGDTETVRSPDADLVETYEDALHRIEAWSRAYPLSVFPEPDFKKAHDLLQAGGMTLDAISASNMRHVVEGVGKIAREALRSGASPSLSKGEE